MIVNRPITIRQPTQSRARDRLSVVRRFTCSGSPRPMAREMTEEAPVPSPSAKLAMVITTGKVKLNAARGIVPSRATKKVSVRLNMMIERMPHVIGAVRRASFAPTGPSVSVAAIALSDLFSSWLPLDELCAAGYLTLKMCICQNR